MIEFDEFAEQWLIDIRVNDPSSVEKGRRFATKIVTQWLEIDSNSDDLVFCDGAGDGGIDIAYLDRASEDDGEINGSTWYLIQSKFGSAFQSSNTLVIEARKLIDTLTGQRTSLSSLAGGLVERLKNFVSGVSERDKVVLVFATTDALSNDEKRALQDVQTLGRERLGAFFDVEAISVRTIYDRLLEKEDSAREHRIEVELDGQLVRSGDDLLVGSVNLINIYSFLKGYKEKSGDLDKLYEKNVRRFLGGRGRVNKAVQTTLREQPERFGLYNNGITIVAENFESLSSDRVRLVDPYVVNGCQTTKSIWEVCRTRLDTGANGVNPVIDAWREKAERGVVVVKVAKVGQAGDALLQAVTRYTNSQNAVREKDFLALTSDFRTWASMLASKYKIFLETQRGGWDSQKAFQKQNPDAPAFSESANAFDLIKVYGAGWLGEAGMAYGKNPPFLPNGAVFKRIMEPAAADSEPFGADDIYASYLLQNVANDLKFGRGAQVPSRRQSRFLFYRVAIELLENEYRQIVGRVPSNAETSRAIIQICGRDTELDARRALFDSAAQAIDEYLTQGGEHSFTREDAYNSTYNGDLNAFLKWEKLGKSDHTPIFRDLMAITRQTMSRPPGNSPRDLLRPLLTTL